MLPRIAQHATRAAARLAPRSVRFTFISIIDIKKHDIFISWALGIFQYHWLLGLPPLVEDEFLPYKMCICTVGFCMKSLHNVMATVPCNDFWVNIANIACSLSHYLFKHYSNNNIIYPSNDNTGALLHAVWLRKSKFGTKFNPPRTFKKLQVP